MTPNDILGLAKLFELAANKKPVALGLVAVYLTPEDCRAISDLLLSINKGAA